MKEKKTLSEEYFSWLCDRVKQKRTYVKLCKILHRIMFRWSVHNDDNRCEDGIRLRELFVEEMNLDETHLEVRYLMMPECTVFEVLVALAERMDELMYQLNDQENHSGRWFGELLLNLKLAEYTDNHSYSDRFDEMTEMKIYDIVETFLDRTYDFDGSGGLFPMKKRPRKDMRKIEIYYQLMEYLAENYGH